jgi:hypothetical protein
MGLELGFFELVSKPSPQSNLDILSLTHKYMKVRRDYLDCNSV